MNPGEMKDIHDIFSAMPNPSTSLWNGDALNPGSIPRVSCLGTTQRFIVEVQKDGTVIVPIRNVKSEMLRNLGHMKELDSVAGVASLTGFANN